MASTLTIVCILCPGHSGSTLLELLLGAHSRIVSAGEAKLFGADGRERLGRAKHLCTCGRGAWTQCSFWARVDQAVRAHSGRALPELDVDHADDRRFAEDNLAFFGALSSVSGRKIVVDSSKMLSRYKRLRRIAELDVRPIRLVRRPEGVVSSYLRADRGWLVWAKRYAQHMARSRVVLAKANPYELRYEDLAADPAGTLRPLMAWLGLEFEETQLRFRDPPQHSVGGNGMRLADAAEIRLDRRWETELGFAQKIAIRAITAPARLESPLVQRFAEPLWKVKSTETARADGLADAEDSGRDGAGNKALAKHPWRLRFRRLTAGSRVLPSFVVAGVQRGGTTSLHRYLERHPCVLSSLVKEVHYFDRSGNFARGERWYRAHFPTHAAVEAVRRAHGTALVGEATPAYLQPHAAARMVELLPEARVIVLLRDPVERAHSGYRLRTAKRGPQRPFAEVIDEELSTFDAAAGLRRRGIYRGLLANGIYVEQLERLLELYEPRLLVLRSEDLYANPENVYAAVLRFLDLPPHSMKRYSAFNRTSGEPMDSATRRKLVDFYAPYNERLYRLLGRDFRWSAP